MDVLKLNNIEWIPLNEGKLNYELVIKLSNVCN
jgi:hypothetical protein